MVIISIKTYSLVGGSTEYHPIPSAPQKQNTKVWMYIILMHSGEGGGMTYMELIK